MVNKKIIIPVAVVLVLIVAGIVLFSSLTSSKTIKAQLSVEQGTVIVNGKVVTGNTELKQGNIIETSADGLATIILYESIVINLEPNTKINLDDLTEGNPSISQEGGETWNQVTNLFGIESYTVKAGTSVASVRGTAFSVAEEKIIVDEGEVDYEIDSQNFRVAKDKVVEKIGETIRERNIRPDEQNALKVKRQRAIQQLKNLRELEIAKHPKVVNLIKDRYGVSDEDIRKGLREADEGKINLEEFKDKLPVKIESADKIIQITEKIQELNA